jgi:hypothetical protein
MASNRWAIEGDFLIGPPDGPRRGARLARIVTGGLALWNKHGHDEVIVTASDLLVILRQRPADTASISVTSDTTTDLSEPR